MKKQDKINKKILESKKIIKEAREKIKLEKKIIRKKKREMFTEKRQIKIMLKWLAKTK